MEVSETASSLNTLFSFLAHLILVTICANRGPTIELLLSGKSGSLNDAIHVKENDL